MNELKIYNTFTQQKEFFQPLFPRHISLYVCGITVYDYCHLGHARIFVAFDTIVRFLRESGWQVKYVQNITDIDDKIIKSAQQNNETIQSLTSRFIKAMQQDMEALNVLAPDEMPRATAHIDKMIALIKKLEEKGVAYVAENGDVYFQVDQYRAYGQLAHKALDQLQAGARVEKVAQKRSHLDFVLWKKAKPQEPAWPSPWGEGRPGWHIECSAMSMALLGETFDIHGGGADLIFPHHENERAQSECATQKPFVNYWMHVGFIQVNKEKMSKSLNNFFTLQEILKDHPPEVVRYFLLASHYRSPINYSHEQLLQAKQALDRLYTALRHFPTVAPSSKEKLNPFYVRFFAAMNDDFNTPEALAILFELTHVIHQVKEKDEKESAAASALLKYLGNILGLLEKNPDSYFQEGLIEEQAFIEELISQREKARNTKNWQEADALRQQLEQKGIVLEDTAQGTVWRRG